MPTNKKKTKTKEPKILKTNKNKRPSKKDEIEKQTKIKPVDLVPIEKTKLPQIKLSDTETVIAHLIANGKNEDEVMTKFGLSVKEMTDLKKNPEFVSLVTELVMSTGIANKTTRISKKKKITERLYGRMLELIEDDNELSKLNINQVSALLQQFELSLEKQLGEDKEQKQNLNVLIMEVVKKNSGKQIENIHEYDPSSDFGLFEVQGDQIIDVSATEVDK